MMKAMKHGPYTIGKALSVNKKNNHLKCINLGALEVIVFNHFFRNSSVLVRNWKVCLHTRHYNN